MSNELSQTVLLPEQLSRLASVSQQTQGALGISQVGSAVRVDAGGGSIFWINANGEDIDPPQE